MSDLISVLLVGHPDPGAADRLRLGRVDPVQADGFSVRALDDDRGVASVLAGGHAHVVVTFGDEARYPELLAAPLDVRRRWLHYADADVPLEQVADAVIGAFVDVATVDRFPETPLVSVFTPTWKTGPQRLVRAYASLRDQRYDNWEWVVYDDSPPEHSATWDLLRQLRAEDPRIQLFRSDRSCGRIGEVKRRCCGLARGSVLAELDHDDELTDHVLGDVVEAFAAHPVAGFAYTDCAEVFEDGENATYPDGYAFGFGSYRTEVYRGRCYAVTNYPEVNAKTVRHIVGMPNHLRAWRREAYVAAGGHSPEVHVADDFELCIRTFLTTRMVHVQRFGYIQRLDRGTGNTHRARNGEIQRLVAAFARRYDDDIHRRLLQLGVDDFIHTEGGLDWGRQPAGGPVRASLQHA